MTKSEKTTAGMVTVGGATVWRAEIEPGWRYSKHSGPELGVTRCPDPHLIYVESGRFEVEMDDGTQVQMGAGDAVFIPPGHDAWTLGDETCVLLELPLPAT